MMSNTLRFTLCLILLILPVIVNSLSFHSKKQTKAQTIEKFYFPNERPQQVLSEAHPQDRQVMQKSFSINFSFIFLWLSHE